VIGVGAGVSAVLFDLDGTLIDSAPDLAATANEMLVQLALPVLPFAELRPHASSGARGMLGAAFGVAPGDARYEALRDEFHQRYERQMLRQTALFQSVAPMLDALDRRRLPWGIVTNKALRFAAPVTQAFGLAARAGVLIGGDSTPHTKPHPAPLLEAARRLQLPPASCIYVGDDPRDIQAGRAAGMGALAAAWGYLGTDLPVHAWGADAVFERPDDLLQWLDLA
jgi:phosphoglycolate phosphatase